jgi:hypothetical protein
MRPAAVHVPFWGEADTIHEPPRLTARQPAGPFYEASTLCASAPAAWHHRPGGNRPRLNLPDDPRLHPARTASMPSASALQRSRWSLRRARQRWRCRHWRSCRRLSTLSLELFVLGSWISNWRQRASLLVGRSGRLELGATPRGHWHL